MRSIFVIRDFEIKGIDISLEDLRRSPPDGYNAMIIPGLIGGRTQGQIFNDAVRRELEKATHVLAFVDLPNANVGFELGYALGLGKPVALARVAAALPGWLTEPPLAGYLAPAARSAEQLRQLVQSDHWIEPPARPASGTSVLFMCPESGEGGSLHGSRRRHHPEWQVLPSSGWSLLDLSSKLDGIRKVVWCVVPYAKDTDERDGRENAADAIVAGFAAACGLDLRVLRHAEARPVADLQQWEHRFSKLDEFERLLAKATDEPANTLTYPTVGRPAISDPVAKPTEHAAPTAPTPPGWPTWSRYQGLAVGVVTISLVLVAILFKSNSVLAIRFAAEHGVVAAQYQLALLLQEGRSVPTDEIAALKWLDQAAQAQHDQALLRLGEMYENGVGVELDAGKAREYFHRAAELGNFDARKREAALLSKQLTEGIRSADVTAAPAKTESTAIIETSITTVPPIPRDKRWPNGATLKVSFLEGSEQDHDLVKRYAALWSEYANINFDFVAQGAQADVRIGFRPGGASWSFEGIDCKAIPQTEPTMNLGWVDQPNVLHQFGHLLGLLHEHQNPNAKFEWNSALIMKEMKDVGWSAAQLESNVTNRYTPQDYVASKPFDPYSVMLYTFPATWTNGIVLKQGQSLSDTDKEYISKLYPGRQSGK